jgi:hypothetical protein
MNTKVKILLMWTVIFGMIGTAYYLLSPKSEKANLAKSESEYNAKIAEINAKEAEIDNQIKSLL